MNISLLHNTRIHIHILVIFCSLITSVASAQDCGDCPDEQIRITYSADNVTPAPGDEICYTIQVDNFESVVIFVFSINFSSNSLRLLPNVNTTVSNLPSFTSSSVILPTAGTGLDIIRVLWSAPGVQGSCLDDGSVLMEVCFEVIGDPGEPILFDINNNGFNGSPVEFISEDSNGMTCAVSSMVPEDGPVDSTSVPTSVQPNCTGRPQIYDRSICGTQNAFNDGLVEFTLLCGTAPYTIDVSNGPSFVTSDSIVLIDSLPQGVYSIVATDASGEVSDPLTVTIDQSTPLIVTPTLRPPRCEDDRTGSIILNVEGGMPFESGDYSFNWDGERFGIGVNDLITLGNGIYEVTVQDSIGCTVRESYTLQTQNPEIDFEIIRQPFCEGRDNGQLRVSGIGGTPFDGTGYTYVLSGVTEDGTAIDRSSPRDAWLENWDVGNIAAGRYVVGVKDSLGFLRTSCEFAFSDTIEITYGRNYDVSVTSGASEDCNGLSRGLVTITADQPPSSISYTIIDSDGQTVVAANGNGTSFSTDCLPGGDYMIVIDDGSGCTADTTFSLFACTITEGPLVEIQPDCFDPLGSLSPTFSTDAEPLTYIWSTGDTTSFLDSLTTGTYGVTVTDADGCSIANEYEIFEPETFTVDFDVENPACPNSFGRITAIPDGGFDPYIYTWDPDPSGLADAVLADIPAGTYRVTVEDDDECIVVDSITLVAPEPPMFSVNNITAPRCEGDPSGAAVVTITPNADYPGPYDFESSSGSRGSNNNFSVGNYPSGENWVIFSDRNSGCIFDTIPVIIPDAPPLEIDFDRSSIGTVSCFGDSGISGATVNLVATTPGVDFTWPDNDVTNVKLQLSAGTYIVTLTAGQCLSVDTVVVTQPDSLELFLDTNLSVLPSCGGEDASVYIGRRGGASGPLNYMWEDASGNIVATDSFALNLPTGEYTIMATDANGCDVVFPLSLMAATPVNAILDDIVQPQCFGEPGIISIASASGGAGNYRFQVNTSQAQPIDQPFSAPPGQYLVSVFDEEGCSFDTSVTIISPMEITAMLGDDIEIDLGETATLSADIFSENQISSITWSPSDDITCANADCSSVTVAPTVDQVYTIEVTDENGCIAIDDILVNVVRSLNVYVPNIISPDAIDIRNRQAAVFTGAGVLAIDFFRIYDRWGNLVHNVENLLPQANGSGVWDGSYNGSTVDAGVYVYVVQLRFDGEAEPIIRKGDITLIR